VTVATAFLAVTLALLLVVLVYVHRLAAGPTVFDRILGVNAFGTTSTVVLLLLGVLYDRLDMFVDVALAYALLTFISSLAAARYFERTGHQR